MDGDHVAGARASPLRGQRWTQQRDQSPGGLRPAGGQSVAGRRAGNLFRHCRSCRSVTGSLSLSFPQIRHSSLLFPQVSRSSLSLSFLPFVPTDHSKFCISVAPISQSQFLVVPTGQSQFCVSVVITVPCHCRSHRSVCSPSCHSHMSVTVVSLSFPQVSHSSLSLSFPRVSNTYADKSVVFVMMMHVAKFCAR